MKIFKQIIAVVLICITCISLVGCFLPKNEELFITHMTDKGHHVMIGPIPLRVTSNNTIVSIDDDIPLQLAYGYDESHSQLEFLSVSAELYMEVCAFEESNDDSNLIVAKTIFNIEDFSENKYKVNVRDILDNKKEDSICCKEDIIIKNEWLVGDKGFIYFNLTLIGNVIDQETGVERVSKDHKSSIAVYYVKQGKKIILFNSYSDYSKYIKNNIFI